MGLKYSLLENDIYSDFSDDFKKRAEIHVLEYQVMHSLINGASPFDIIEELCKSNNEMSKKLEEFYTYGIPPIILQYKNEDLTKEDINKLVKK